MYRIFLRKVVTQHSTFTPHRRHIVFSSYSPSPATPAPWLCLEAMQLPSGLVISGIHKFLTANSEACLFSPHKSDIGTVSHRPVVTKKLCSWVFED